MGRPLRITFFGTYNTGRHPRVDAIREGLVALGHSVEVINVPLDLDTAARVQLAAQPWRAPVVGMRVLVAWARLMARSVGSPRPDVVVIGYLGHFDVHLARMRWPRRHLVVDHLVSLVDTIDDRQIAASSIVLRALALADRAATAQAGTVLVDTQEQIDQLPPQHRHKAVVVPVGAPSAWFDTTPTVPDPDGPLRVVFFGLYTPLQGTPVIGAAIGKLAAYDISWTMIGAGQERVATEAASDGAIVTWHDWIDADDLPAVVAEHDVCLGIFGTGPKARRVVPNKVFQGAAAGCAIVTSDTPAQRTALGDAAIYVPPGDSDELAAAIARLADDRDELARLRLASRETARRSFTPASVVAGLARALARAHDDSMPARATTVPPLPPNAALRWHVVQRHLDDIRPTTILELGAGQGAAGARLARRGRYVGVEPDETSRAMAAIRLPPDAVLVSGLNQVPEGETFDLACAFEVLEHISDDVGALTEWVGRVRPGGHVLVSVPADPERFGPADELAGHFRRYGEDDLASVFLAAGLKPVAVKHYGHPAGAVLEWGRNTIAARRLARDAPNGLATRTAASGRHLQPPPWAGGAIWWATAPFRALQGRYPDRGTGLLGLARRPD